MALVVEACDDHPVNYLALFELPSRLCRLESYSSALSSALFPHHSSPSLCCFSICICFPHLTLQFLPTVIFFTLSISLSFSLPPLLWLFCHFLSASFTLCSEMGRLGPPPFFSCFFSFMYTTPLLTLLLLHNFPSLFHKPCTLF